MNRLISICMLFLIIGCDGPSKKDEKNPLCIVICDFTNSMAPDSNSIDGSVAMTQVKENAAQLFKKMMMNWDMYFYSIEERSVGPFFKSEAPTRTASQIELNRFAVQLPTCDSVLRKRMDSLSGMRNRNSTCIIPAIENAIRQFQEYGVDSNVEARLILLSDMRECCNYPTRNIRINIERVNPSREEAKLPYVSTFTGSVKGMDKLRVSVVLTSLQRITDLNELENFWKTCLKRYGYTDSLRMVTTLPTEIMNN